MKNRIDRILFVVGMGVMGGIIAVIATYLVLGNNPTPTPSTPTPAAVSSGNTTFQASWLDNQVRKVLVGAVGATVMEGVSITCPTLTAPATGYEAKCLVTGGAFGSGAASKGIVMYVTVQDQHGNVLISGKP